MKNVAAFENESASAVGSQSSQNKWKNSGNRMNDTDFLKNFNNRDQYAQSTEYLRYYQNLQKLN